MEGSYWGARRRNSNHHCTTNRDWSKLVPELLEAILSKLSFINIVRFQLVCSDWRSVVKNSCVSSSPQLPWLMVGPYQEDDSSNDSSFYFFCPEDSKIYKIKKHQYVDVDDLCIGSSKGWLMFVNYKKQPYLLNPFLQERITLPSIDIQNLDYTKRSTSAALLFEPSQSQNYIVAVIQTHGAFGKFAVFKSGDRKWTTISGAYGGYCRIAFHRNLLFAHTISDGYIEAWDVQARTPTKTLTIRAGEIDRMLKDRWNDSRNSYLVESSEKLLFVVKAWARDYQRNFLVFELDFEEKKWMQVESLGDKILFLDEHMQPTLVAAKDFPECEGDSIYFIDDKWSLGVFNLRDGSSRRCLLDRHYCLTRITPPFWIAPNKCRIAPPLWITPPDKCSHARP